MRNTRDYGKNHPRFVDNDFLKMAHHEQSETVEAPGGEWINVYGKKTPKAGQQLPDTPAYPTVDEAAGAARQRSEDYGREHPEHEDEE